MKRRIVAAILICCLLLSGCELTETLTEDLLPIKNEPVEDTTTLQNVSLLYYPTDGLHPLMDTSLANQQIYRSVFLPAITFNERLEPIYGVASEVVQKDNSISITPETTARFSDGSPVTAKDIADCFSYALSHKDSPYHRQLSMVTDVSSTNGRVVLTLKNEDPGALYCMDIPILKQTGSEKKPVYLGAGAYKFGKYRDVPALLPNPHAKEVPLLSPIYLLTPDSDQAVTSMFNSGVLSALPTNLIADGTFSASRSYKTVSYLTNSMIFIGVNNEELHTAARRALSAMIPRQEIIDNVLMGLGQSAVLPLYPGWSQIPDPGAYPTKERLLELFTAAGFVAKNGELTEKSGNKPQFELLLCEDNKQHLAIAEKMRTAALELGIELKIEQVSEYTFSYRLENGNYEMYIARYTLNNNLSCGELYIGDEAPNYCGTPADALRTAHENFLAGGSVADYVTTLEREAPILPIAFVKRAVYHTEGLSPTGGLSVSRPLGAPEKWTAS